jgi:hypothetical protein
LEKISEITVPDCMQPARLHAASQIACSQPALNPCLSGAAGIQNLCLIWLLGGIQRPPFEQLNPEMLSFPTRPQTPAESNREMKSTVRRSICPKNGRGALYRGRVVNDKLGRRSISDIGSHRAKYRSNIGGCPDAKYWHILAENLIYRQFRVSFHNKN